LEVRVKPLVWVVGLFVAWGLGVFLGDQARPEHVVYVPDTAWVELAQEQEAEIAGLRYLVARTDRRIEAITRDRDAAEEQLALYEDPRHQRCVAFTAFTESMYGYVGVGEFEVCGWKLTSSGIYGPSLIEALR
jgi:hypothetical protein